MAKEIERKFLVRGDAWRSLAKGTTYRQGYLNSAKERTVRVRVADAKASLTVKGVTVGATRSEYEYEIPLPLSGSIPELPHVAKVVFPKVSKILRAVGAVFM
jgi:CYTH domain-containing protein